MKFGDILRKDIAGNPALYYIGFSAGKHLAWDVNNNCVVHCINMTIDTNVMHLSMFKEPDFKAYDRIIVAGNIMQSRYLLEDEGFRPLIIGFSDGLYPVIWIYKKSDGRVYPLVERNTPINERIKCECTDDYMIIRLFDDEKKIWKKMLRVLIKENVIPEIDFLDLRGLGYSIYSQKSFSSLFTEQLVVCGRVFQGKTFINNPSAFTVKEDICMSI